MVVNKCVGQDKFRVTLERFTPPIKWGCYPARDTSAFQWRSTKFLNVASFVTSLSAMSTSQFSTANNTCS